MRVTKKWLTDRWACRGGINLLEAVCDRLGRGRKSVNLSKRRDVKALIDLRDDEEAGWREAGTLICELLAVAVDDAPGFGTPGDPHDPRWNDRIVTNPVAVDLVKYLGLVEGETTLDQLCLELGHGLGARGRMSAADCVEMILEISRAIDAHRRRR